jgi:hydroxyacylglutathione hydrolase
MKRQNRDGPPVLGKPTNPYPRGIALTNLQSLDFKQAAILDTRPWSDFKAGHLPGALRDPLDNTFNTIAASYLSDDQDMYIVCQADQYYNAVVALIRVGLDRIRGYITPQVLAEYAAAGGKLETTGEVNKAAAKGLIASGAFILDVRRKADEFDLAHIDGAVNVPHLRLSAELSNVPKDRTILVTCRSGSRSSRAASYLQRHGYNAINLEGGFEAWQASH